MNAFDRYARDGEGKFHQWLIRNPWATDIEPKSGDTYCHYDFAFNAIVDENEKKVQYIVEVKGRQFESTSQHAKDGLFLEAQKFFNLLPYAYKGRQIRYVNTFSDGAMYMWNLNAYADTEPTPEWREMNYQTAADNTHKVRKPVFLMRLDDATRLQ